MDQSALREVDYVHPALDREVTAIGGHYVFTEEKRVVCGGREVLALIGYAVYDTTCCGAGGCSYALVPGIVVRASYRQSPEGRPVSRVIPILDSALRQAVAKLLKNGHPLQQIVFNS